MLTLNKKKEDLIFENGVYHFIGNKMIADKSPRLRILMLDDTGSILEAV